MVTLSDILREDKRILRNLWSNIKKCMRNRREATLGELRDDYEREIQDGWLPRTFREIEMVLQMMPEITFFDTPAGLRLWKLVASKRSISPLEQGTLVSKRPRLQDITRNINRIQKEPPKESWKPPEQPEASIKGYKLVGDDFFYGLATSCFKVPSFRDSRSKSLSTGYCVCGLTLKGALVIVNSLRRASKVLLLVGAVDIVSGRDFNQMSRDFYALLGACKTNYVQLVVCTLPPLVNQTYNGNVRLALHRFNSLVRMKAPNVLDLHTLFTDSKHPKLKFFEPPKKNLANPGVAQWNEKGREEFLNFARENLNVCIE